MKKLILAFLLVFSFVLLGCGESYPQNISVYSFDTATIKYQLSGSVNGEEMVYIRGDQKAVHRNVILADGTMQNTLNLKLGSEDFNADLDKMTAVKVKNEDYDVLAKMNDEEQKAYLLRKELGLKDGAEMPEALIETTIAGQKCEVYEISNIGSACIWNGIVLDKEISMLGIVNKKQAVSVTVDSEVPDERFELPAGVILKN